MISGIYMKKLILLILSTILLTGCNAKDIISIYGRDKTIAISVESDIILEENNEPIKYIGDSSEGYAVHNDNYYTIDISFATYIGMEKVGAPVKLTEQRLPHFERQGFAATEWGGVIYK